MRILVTGTTGQVGGALVQALAGSGDIIAADRSVLDLSNVAGLNATLDRLAPDLVINPAAYTAVDRAEDEVELAFTVNAHAPAAMAAWAAAHRVPMIHFSTDYVYDGSGNRAYVEDTVPGPLSVYGRSKLAGETAVRDEGGPHLILRTSWVYASTGSNFMRTMARLGRERPQLRVVCDQFGAPTSARAIADAVQAMVRAQSAPGFWTSAAANRVYHVACSGVTSWHGFAVAILDGLRNRGIAVMADDVVPIATSEYPTKAKRPANSRLDLSRLKASFGLVPPAWETALAVELDALARDLTPA